MTTFDEETFLQDATTLADAIAAPFQTDITRRVLGVFGDDFHTGGVQWKRRLRARNRIMIGASSVASSRWGCRPTR
ncbi:aromatic prenyltransferase [Streptomyces sp. NPDC001928]|uniref:aromatic prenyltransferase n=1 Tax=Streptomyces sp. NPDC001928 TaxID=3154404 RepID=UPI00332E6517